jgi:hypothetical protein
MILITAANTIATKLSKIIAVDSVILKVGDGVAVGVGSKEGVGEGEGEEVGERVGEEVGERVGEEVGEVEASTKSAGSISGGRGVWLKLNEFIMSLAFTSLVPNEGRLKICSASLSIEANSYCVLSM